MLFWGQAGWERQLPNCEFFSTQAICRCVFACFSSPGIVLLTHNCGLPSKPINLVFFSSDVTTFCSVYPRSCPIMAPCEDDKQRFPPQRPEAAGVLMYSLSNCESENEAQFCGGKTSSAQFGRQFGSVWRLPSPKQ